MAYDGQVNVDHICLPGICRPASSAGLGDRENAALAVGGGCNENGTVHGRPVVSRQEQPTDKDRRMG